MSMMYCFLNLIYHAFYIAVFLLSHKKQPELVYNVYIIEPRILFKCYQIWQMP